IGKCIQVYMQPAGETGAQADVFVKIYLRIYSSAASAFISDQYLIAPLVGNHITGIAPEVEAAALLEMIGLVWRNAAPVIGYKTMAPGIFVVHQLFRVCSGKPECAFVRDIAACSVAAKQAGTYFKPVQIVFVN